MKCVKYLLFAFNLLFVLIAIGLIAVGAYVQIALKDYFDLIEGSFSSAAALLIAVGVIIFFIASFGCFGAHRENRVCVLIFAGLMVIIFIMEIAGGIAGFVMKGKVQDSVEKYMEKTLKEKNRVWDEVQKDFKCCGIHNYTDWGFKGNSTTDYDIPKYCCKDLTDPCLTTTAGFYNQGCLSKFTDWLKDHIYYVGAVGIAFAVIQLIGITFACCLARAIKKEYEVV